MPKDDIDFSTEPEKKRSSKDFEPDMDMLLITAQSSMIIEGVNAMKNKDFSGKKLQVYMEAFKGIELYIKILERSPDNYNKLNPIINKDPDCTEVKTIAFTIYKNKHKVMPSTDGQILEAYEIFRDRMKNAYYKALVSQTMINLKNYYMLSGSLDEDAINKHIASNPEKIKSDMEKIGNTVSLAAGLIKSGNTEISEGLKGKDINMFIIKATQLLTHYYTAVNNKTAAERYQHLNTVHSKYFVIR